MAGGIFVICFYSYPDFTDTPNPPPHGTQPTLDPGGGEHGARCQLREDSGDSDALQALHLLCEGGRAARLAHIVQLMEEAQRPLVYQADPVSADLHACTQAHACLAHAGCRMSRFQLGFHNA